MLVLYTMGVPIRVAEKIVLPRDLRAVEPLTSVTAGFLRNAKLRLHIDNKGFEAVCSVESPFAIRSLTVLIQNVSSLTRRASRCVWRITVRYMSTI